MTFGTAQENFWAGEFGSDYAQRNFGPELVAANTALFSKVFARTRGISSVIEFGANVGLNLRAIERLLPGVPMTGVEINQTAASELRAWGGAAVLEKSMLELPIDRSWDFALIKGVLIHINPEELPRAYDQLYKATGRYLCVVEYYNPTPVSVPYRGHGDRLFKRDFAGEIMDRFPALSLVDYGFIYHRDTFRQDDITWFLMEKSSLDI